MAIIVNLDVMMAKRKMRCHRTFKEVGNYYGEFIHIKK